MTYTDLARMGTVTDDDLIDALDAFDFGDDESPEGDEDDLFSWTDYGREC